MKTEEWTQKAGHIHPVQYNSEIEEETTAFPVTGKTRGEHTK